jgi:hypothetical protein
MRRVHSKLDIYILKSQISQPMVNIRQTIGNKKIDISKWVKISRYNWLLRDNVFYVIPKITIIGTTQFEDI